MYVKRNYENRAKVVKLLQIFFKTLPAKGLKRVNKSGYHGQKPR